MTLLLIIKLVHHTMDFGHPWRKKHEVLLDIINNSIPFFPEYCIHLGALLSFITSKKERIETTLKVNHKDLTSKQILQRCIDENLDDFLIKNIKLAKKKRWLHNTSKRKLSGVNQKSKIVGISLIDNSGKEDFPILPTTLIFDKIVIDVALISAAIHHATYKFNVPYVFNISMRDLELQQVKKAQPETNQKYCTRKVSWLYNCLFKKRLRYTSPPLKIWS